MPFSESEMALWEDHWIITAQKLQQWDVLAELVLILLSFLYHFANLTFVFF